MRSVKKALITGIAGQDGSYMAERLLAEGMQVFGLVRDRSHVGFAPSEAQLVEGDLADLDSLRSVIQAVKPDGIYNLGGVTDLKTAYEFPERTWTINGESVRVLLEESALVNPRIRFLQASSSEIFLPSSSPLTETSTRDLETQNPYARAKLFADEQIRLARERGVFACSAILFNHESPRRSERSAIRKICQTLVKISLGLETVLKVGNLEQSRDWGDAEDFVDAMRRMMQHEAPEDFVIASGELHQVKEIVFIAAQHLGLELEEGMVVVDPLLVRPTEIFPKFGDLSKARKLLDWEPQRTFESLIHRIVDADLALFSETSS